LTSMSSPDEVSSEPDGNEGVVRERRTPLSLTLKSTSSSSSSTNLKLSADCHAPGCGVAPLGSGVSAPDCVAGAEGLVGVDHDKRLDTPFVTLLERSLNVLREGVCFDGVSAFLEGVDSVGMTPQRSCANLPRSLLATLLPALRSQALACGFW